ncbi:MAG TPA: DUF2079 domain-containing protein [Polyangiaceae bacterium]|nr:DUF2079 domain-containing protein [Polyangiaceae bacterium]
MGLATQALAIFAGVGASLGLFFQLLQLPPGVLSDFIGGNLLAAPPRTSLSLGFLLGGLLGGGLALAFLAIRRRAGVAGLRRAADVVFPLALTFLLPSLFTAKPWSTSPTIYLLQLVGTVLALEWTIRRSLLAWPKSLGDWFVGVWPRSPRFQKYSPLVVVLLGSATYAAYFGYYTILNHHRLGTSGFDLGININWSYNALRGQFWRSTVLYGEAGGHFLANHAIFAMFAYLPLFALKPDAEFFLIAQALIVGFSATTLYLFASTQIPRWSAVVVALAYLMYAPLHGPNFYDYHELLPPLFFHFLLYWAIATRRNWLVALNIVVIWAFREDLPVGTCVLGLFLLLTGARPRLGLVIAVSSLVWFILLKFVIMSSAGSWWFSGIYKDLQPPGTNGYGPVVQTILINPSYFLKTLLREDKLVYFLHMMAPVALLPMRRAALLILAIPGFAFSLLTTGYAPTLSISFQYTCHSIPYIFAASVLMLKLLGQGERGHIRRRAALGALALGMLSHSYVFGAVLQHETFVGGFSHIEFDISQAERQRYETVKKMNAMIPREASVAASEDLVPHVAARLNVYTLKDGGAFDADYVFLHGSSVQSDNSRSGLNTMFSRDDYGLVASGDDLYLFKRGFDSEKTKAALSTLRIRKSHR